MDILELLEKATTFTFVYNAAIYLISGLIMLRGANWLLPNLQLSHDNLIFLTVVSCCKKKTTCLGSIVLLAIVGEKNRHPVFLPKTTVMF